MKIKLYDLHLAKSEKTIPQASAALAASTIQTNQPIQQLNHFLKRITQFTNSDQFFIDKFINT
jgi:hypothetical protein